MRMVLIAATALLVTGCGSKDKGTAGATGTGTSSAPVRHQPGSWSNKIDITDFDGGPGVDSAAMKGQIQNMFAAASSMSVCITPELAASDNIEANIERMAAQGKKCDFSRKVIDGEKIDFAGTCSDASGTKVDMSFTGTNTATKQDLQIKVTPVGKPGSMTMHVVGQRNGECKPGDLRPPVPAKTS